jgi:hypothetical protein
MTNIERFELIRCYDFLITNGICSTDFLQGALAVGGENKETYETVLYYITGYRDFSDFAHDNILDF